MPADHDDCLSCGPVAHDDDLCKHSQHACGHHCNHSWTHDRCCWCGIEFDEDGEVLADAR